MKSNLKTLLEPISPEKGFEANLILILQKNRVANLKHRTVAFILLVLASFGAVIPTSIFLVQDLSKSGFSSLLSLIISENTTVLVYAKEFAISLVESVPTFSLAIFLIIFGAFLWSLVSLNKTVREGGGLVLMRHA